MTTLNASLQLQFAKTRRLDPRVTYTNASVALLAILMLRGALARKLRLFCANPDLIVERGAEQVDGPKLAWGLALLVNWIGPIAYFTKGRLPQA